MRRHKPFIEELRERGRQKLTAEVPAAIKALEQSKKKLEARIEAGKTLSPRRKPLSAPELPPPPALELTEAQAKHAVDVSKALGAATGVGDNKYVATRIFAQFNSMLLSGTDARTTLFLLSELHPGNVLEAMLITQMVGTYEASLAFLRTSTAEGQDDFRAQNVARSTRLMRLFMEQLEQLQRLRGNTRQQRVTVEHVHVNTGGQAIVGVVEHPGVRKKTDEPHER
jgi:hypothetical protein